MKRQTNDTLDDQNMHVDCRKWKKGRSTQLTFNPRIGSIDTICVDFQEDLMMAASEEQGEGKKKKRKQKCLGILSVVLMIV